MGAVDGCGDLKYYKGGYAAMGEALEKSGRDIVYSCSWPAYIGSNESEKPFAVRLVRRHRSPRAAQSAVRVRAVGIDRMVWRCQEMIMDGCNLWRNYDDIQCSWGSLSEIIDHWGTQHAAHRCAGYGSLVLRQYNTQHAAWPCGAASAHE
jgi:alpha-N-acetylgalactosaminidase